jgi:phage FluMu protein Com
MNIINLIKTKKTISAIKKYLYKHNNILYNDIIDKSSFIKDNNFSLKLYCYHNNITSLPICPICQTNTLVYKNFSIGFTKYCSIPCAARAPEKIKNSINTKIKKHGEGFQKLAAAKAKQTWIKKYGTDNPNKCKSVREKMKNTNLKKYGVEWTFQDKNQIKKTKKTMIKKYGVENFTQSLEYKNKIKQHSLNKYNTTHYLKSKKVIDKRKNTMLKKYGVDNIFKSKLFQNQNQVKSKKMFFENHIKTNPLFEPLFSLDDYTKSTNEYKWRCKRCQTEFSFITSSGFTTVKCPKCDKINSSKSQQEIKNFIQSIYNDTILSNTRKILDNKFEIDLYLPEIKTAIEFNGNYWHSENNAFSPKDKYYHNKKLNECISKNINLIQIFEDEWANKQQIVKNRLKHILGCTKYKIYGRKCIIKEIDTPLKNKFLEKYHIQGADKSSVKLGAFYKNRLVAVMTFGKRKITGAKKQEWELIRYCTIGNFNCIGMPSKLLKRFYQIIDNEKIITYADRRWSNGNMYYKLGFKLDHISSPNYWYMNKKNYFNRIHRTSFMKYKLKNKLEVFDANISEWENMKNNGWDRIWDCGNYVFVNKVCP